MSSKDKGKNKMDLIVAADIHDIPESEKIKDRKRRNSSRDKEESRKESRKESRSNSSKTDKGEKERKENLPISRDDM